MDEPVEYRTVLMDRNELLSRLREAVELFEMSDACNDPGSDAWAWLYAAKDTIDKVTSADQQPPASLDNRDDWT